MGIYPSNCSRGGILSVHFTFSLHCFSLNLNQFTKNRNSFRDQIDLWLRYSPLAARSPRPICRHSLIPESKQIHRSLFVHYSMLVLMVMTWPFLTQNPARKFERLLHAWWGKIVTILKHHGYIYKDGRSTLIVVQGFKPPTTLYCSYTLLSF